MVYSQQTAQFYAGPQAGRKVEDPALGMYQALIEARIPFEMVHDRMLDAAYLDRYKLLIMPNIAALSDAQCEQIRDYVRRGGSSAGDLRDIVSTTSGETGGRTLAWAICLAPPLCRA